MLVFVHVLLSSMVVCIGNIVGACFCVVLCCAVPRDVMLRCAVDFCGMF